MPTDIKLFSDLKDACIDIVKVLPSLNNTQRREIRDILLQLKRDLTDSIVLAEQYLNSIRRSTRENDILQQMYDAPSRLLQAYNEFKICAALYHLHDRFDQWFSSVKATVKVQNVRAIRALITRIADGEQFVMQELETLLRALPTYAQEYEDAAQGNKGTVLENAQSYIKESLALLRKAETTTKTAINAAIALM
ncbi:MAG: hypothetical protein KJ072_27985 [Verrucomicrobia bacterium]|nr:hypothetical protein [Verrucomicrobiota bacterium]